MRLNGYFIDYVEKWNKNKKGEITINDKGNYLEASETKISDIEHKVRCTVKHEQTAEELAEMFANPTFNIVEISDFYIDEYNGIYQLTKGNIDQDGGSESWVVDLWLENKSDWVKQSILKEEFDTDFSDLQAETSTFGSLVDGTAENGTWATSNDGFGMTSGTTGIYTIGHEHWNSIVWNADIVFTSVVSTVKCGAVINFHDTNDYYYVTFEYDGTDSWVYARKMVNGDPLIIQAYKIPTEDLITGFSAGTTYNMKVIASGNRIDAYLDYKHVISIYDAEFVAGKCGYYSADTNGYFKNASVQLFVPAVQTIPAGFVNNEYPENNNYIRTRDGLLQYIVNFEEEIINRHYPSRLNVGKVKVWDTIDNDFSQANVPPLPLRWSRVYNINHKFIGNIYVENGLFGMLYTKAGTYFYVYDQAHLKGTQLDIDFKQNPNYELYNSQYEGRQFVHPHSGASQWTETGLDFDMDNNKNDETDQDLVYNKIQIPEIQTAHHRVGRVLEAKFKPEDNDRRAEQGGYGIVVGEAVNSTVTPAVMLHHDSDYLAYMVERSTPTNDTFVSNNTAGDEASDEWHEIVIVDNADNEGALFYKDGILQNWGTKDPDHDYNYEESPNGNITVGGTNSGTWANYHYNGEIEYAKMKHPSKGRTRLRSLDTPFVHFTFDEDNWDEDNEKWEDKGSKGIDFTNTGNVSIIKEGRFNEAVYFADTTDYARNNTLTTELDNMTEYTVEFWLKYEDTPADFHFMCRVINATQRLFDFYIDVSNFNFMTYDGTTFRGVSVAHASHTVDDDGKWHHIAGTWDGTTIKFYIDGALVGSNATVTSNPCPLPTEFKIGGFTGAIDELVVYDFAKDPEEFGLFNPEIYNRGQWYSNAEIENKEGTLRRRDTAKIPNVAVQYFNDTFVNVEDGVAGYISSGTFRTSLTATPGGSGLGIGCSSYDTDSDGGYYIGQGDEKYYDVCKPFTTQFYFRLKKVPAFSSNVIYFRRWTGSDSSVPYIHCSTDPKLSISVSGGTTSDLVDSSTVLSVDTIYHVMMQWDVNDSGTGTATIYLDGVFYRSYTVSNVNNIDDHLGRGIGIFTSWNPDEGEVSNFTLHDGLIPLNHRGIIVDTKTEIPKLVGELYRVEQSGGQLNLTKTRIKSISPEIVEIQFMDNADNINTWITAWIESGDFYYKIDNEASSVKRRTADDSMYFIQLDDEYRFRFALGINDDDDPVLEDSFIETANFGLSVSSTDATPYKFLLDNRRSDMVLSINTTSTQTDNNKIWLGRVNRAIDTVHIKSGDGGYITIGMIPQRHINEIFWDTTQTLESGSGITISKETGDWFTTKRRTISGNYTGILSTDDRINYERYPKGLYLIVGHGFTGDASHPIGLNDITEGSTTLGQTGSTTMIHFYGWKVMDKQESEVDWDLSMGSTGTSPSSIIYRADYWVIIPISNGYDMLLDLARQSLAKKTKLNILH